MEHATTQDRRTRKRARALSSLRFSIDLVISTTSGTGQLGRTQSLSQDSPYSISGLAWSTQPPTHSPTTTVPWANLVSPFLLGGTCQWLFHCSSLVLKLTCSWLQIYGLNYAVSMLCLDWSRVCMADILNISSTWISSIYLPTTLSTSISRILVPLYQDLLRPERSSNQCSL